MRGEYLLDAVSRPEGSPDPCRETDWETDGTRTGPGTGLGEEEGFGVTEASCHPDRRHHARGMCRPCYNGVYYAGHKGEEKARAKIYQAEHREAYRAQRKAYRAAHLEEAKRYDKAYNVAHRAEFRLRDAEKNAVCKLEALNAYGGAICACCGEDLFEGLTLDHVDGDGAAWRRERGTRASGAGLYAWLKKNGYPHGFQVLCGTCNLAKRIGDHCPHQDAWI